MKAILLYITAMLTVALLCSEINFIWLILLVVDSLLVYGCHKTITLEELVRYSGYSIWYKLLSN